MASTQDFILQFHSLKGLTIGERRKNLFQLLKIFPNNIDLNRINPKTPLEEVFKIECFIHNKKSEDLIKSLQSENPVIIEKILKTGSNFIRDAFKNITGETLVTNLFPLISYNTKLKLLNMFSLHLPDVKQADDYFQAIEEKYGVYLASKMLCCCSRDTIIQCIQKTRVEITPRHMLKILHRFPGAAEELLTTLSLHNNKLGISDKYTWVFKHLAKTNIDLCLKLLETYKPHFYVGIRATRSIIKKNKENFMSNPKVYVNFLRKSEIGNVLQNDFNNFFLTVFPTTVSKVNETLSILLLLLKRVNCDKLSVLLRTFREVHGKDMWDFPMLIQPELLGLMGDDERQLFLETHDKPEHISSVYWISLMTCDKSLPLLKEKVQTVTVFSSFELGECLVRTCVINRDIKALLDVLSFLKQHNKRLESDFLLALTRFFDFSLLKEDDDWKCLLEYVELCKTKGCWLSEATQILQQYLRYCLERNMPIFNHLFSWADTIKVSYCKYSISDDLKFQRRCLEEFMEMDPSDFPDNSYLDYLNSVERWNRHNSRSKIKLNLNASAWDAIKNKLETKYEIYSIIDVTEVCIYNYPHQASDRNILSAFYKNSFYDTHLRVAIWLIKWCPDVFLSNIENITKNLLQVDRVPLHFKNVFKYYTHLNIPSTMKNICLQNFEKEGAVVWFSVLADPEEFTELYHRNQSINLMENLKNMCSSTATLNLIKELQTYDHIQYIQRPLYLAAHVLSETNLIVPFFESLKHRDIHLKKHVIFLAFKVLSKETVLSMLNELLKDRNHLVCKYTFKGIFNLFMRSPDEKLWGLTQHVFEYLNKNDMEIFRILSSYRRIPKSFFIPYLKFAWEALEEVFDERYEITLAKSRILESLTMDAIATAPEDFCLKIVEKHLFVTESIAKSVILFSCRFLITKPKYVGAVFKKVQDGVSSSSALVRRSTMTFVEDFSMHFLNNKSLHPEIFLQFVTLWDSVLKPEEAYRQYLHLHFTEICVNCRSSSIEKLGATLANFCNSVDENLLDLQLFTETFKLLKTRFCGLFFELDFNMANLMIVESILEHSSTNSCLLFAINILPEDYLDGKVRSKYDAIIQFLWQRLTPVTSVYFYRHLSR